MAGLSWFGNEVVIPFVNKVLVPLAQEVLAQHSDGGPTEIIGGRIRIATRGTSGGWPAHPG